VGRAECNPSFSSNPYFSTRRVRGTYDTREPGWDLRASAADWNKWCDKGLGMMSLGVAYRRREPKFQVGNYGAMIKNPAMAGPFIKNFTVMGTVPRDQTPLTFSRRCYSLQMKTPAR